MDALEAAQPGCARFVGGCVRNALLGEPVADVDIATQLTPDRVEQVMRAAGIAVHPTGIEHGTLTVVADHQPFEVTTLRRDVETDGRRAIVAFTEDWAEDAQRRDFRMNALYVDRDGEVYDPTGGGLDDVGGAAHRVCRRCRRRASARTISASCASSASRPGTAARRRMRRGWRPAASCAPGSTGISAERIWMETKKLLAAPQPMPSLRAMEAGGVFAQLFPEAKGLDLLGQAGRARTRAAWTTDPMLRFLALFWKDEAAAAGVALRLKLSNEERDRLVCAARHTSALDATSPHDVRVAMYRSGARVVKDLALLEWARDRRCALERRDQHGRHAGLCPRCRFPGPTCLPLDASKGLRWGRGCKRPKKPGFPAISRWIATSCSLWQFASTPRFGCDISSPLSQ